MKQIILSIVLLFIVLIPSFASDDQDDRSIYDDVLDSLKLEQLQATLNDDQQTYDRLQVTIDEVRELKDDNGDCPNDFGFGIVIGIIGCFLFICLIGLMFSSY